MFSAVARTVLLTDDPEATLAFYRDVLGFTVLHDETQDGYRFLHVGLSGGAGLWIMPTMGTDEHERIGRQTGGQPLLVLTTDDLDLVADRLRQARVETWAERDDEHSRSLHFRDVLGNILVAVELRA